ncbi:glycosyltransferase family 9 protein [Fundidesulfovibrio butyratiphilus]
MSGEAAPALVLQMQRMGDIVLSFPLFLWLARHSPARPVWVVAEPVFYEELKGLSPSVVYIPWTATEHLESRPYALIVNLSHRREAAQLAGRLDAPRKIGPVIEPDGTLRVRGTGQLYRTSLSHNNRYNRFHWAELNALDCTDPGVYAATRFDSPRWPDRREKSVGLFLGASQESKRPDVSFSADLVFELERRGLKVALFGGPADVELGRAVEQATRGRPVNLCGRLSLRQFMAAGQTLDLLVTPDTGPMHVAAWSGLATLNLSMGPVSPWETGPFPAGHFVLRAAMSCLGCWRCRFDAPRCRERFRPRDVAYLVWRLLATGGDAARLTAPKGTRLFRTARTPDGLYDLERIGSPRVDEILWDRGGAPKSGSPSGSRIERTPRPGPDAALAPTSGATAPLWPGSAGDVLGEFWRSVFAAHFRLVPGDRPSLAWAGLVRTHPRLALALARHLADLARRVSLARAASPVDPGQDFWLGAAPLVRPLAGFMHMRAQNADLTPKAWTEALGLLETVLAACS